MLHLLKSNHRKFSSQIASYVRRGKHRPKSSIKVGDQLYGFRLQKSQQYPDFDLTHRHFVNDSQKTQFHQLECSQQTNTVSLIFKLKDLPFPSINYALQKMLNGGSTKYPIRQLIEAAKQKSFNNVLYTSTINEDYMMFNFSTPIIKDYKQLMSIYHNMLFRPLLRKQDFEQLVWRYHIEGRKLQIKGELADVMKENDYYEENFVYRQIVKNFFVKSNATICAQQDLPKFNYQDLVKFYQETINPNNLTIIHHGDMSSEFILNSWNQICEQNKSDQTPKSFTVTNINLNSSNLSNCDNSKNPRQEDSLKSNELPKTIKFEHMKPQTILMLSFKIQNANEEEKALLSVLSYLLFDMPESPFMKFNTPQTPYPLLYGHKNRYFNVGITFNDIAESQNKLSQAQIEKLMKQKQDEIWQTLRSIAKKQLPSTLIEKCLAHLQANYFTQNGLKIIQSIVDPIISEQSLKSTLSPMALIQKLFKKYRKDNIFESLIRKFLLENQNYICFRGFNNYELVQNIDLQREKKLSQIKKSLSEEAVQKILAYRPPNLLQDIKTLPELNPIDLEFFEDTEPAIIKFDNVKVYYQTRLNGLKVTFKSDISDLNEDLFPFLELFCKSFAQMGTKLIKDNAYQQILSRYINSIDLRYETQKSRQDPNQMKVYLFMTVDFNDRYFEYGFSLINGLIKGWNHGNIFALSKIIQKCASQCFHSISQDIISIHGRHLAASKSPFAFFESPIFNSRSLTGMAGDLRKVSNPKQILNGISFQLLSIYQTVFQKPRIQVMFECKQSKKDFYMKYLQLTIKELNSDAEGVVGGISVQNFPQERWLKYFPNFQQELIFQCFKFPYYEKKSAAALIFTSLVNRNILQYNKVGGCFLFKGAMLAFIGGGRKKVLQLQDYYRKIQDIDEAKRSIFKRFGRYTAKSMFETGISIQEARFFKQAVIATEKQEVQQILNEFILEPLKKGQSSILSLGPRIENYEPLLKKGWEIQRSVDDLAMNVQSFNSNEPVLKLQDFTKIC